MSREIEIILLADCSGSMKDSPINAVNSAIRKINTQVKYLQKKYTVKISFRVIGFSDTAFYIRSVEKLLIAGGKTNLSSAFRLLDKKLTTDIRKNRIIMLLTDGVPTSLGWQKELDKLYQNDSFKYSQRIGICYKANGKDSYRVLKKFAGSGLVCNVFDTIKLEKLIQRLTINKAERNIKTFTVNIKY